MYPRGEKIAEARDNCGGTKKQEGGHEEEGGEGWGGKEDWQQD